MKNRSLKAGGRLNWWSFKAGFTVCVYLPGQCIFLCCLGMCLTYLKGSTRKRWVKQAAQSLKESADGRPRSKLQVSSQSADRAHRMLAVFSLSFQHPLSFTSRAKTKLAAVKVNLVLRTLYFDERSQLPTSQIPLFMLEKNWSHTLAKIQFEKVQLNSLRDNNFAGHPSWPGANLYQSYCVKSLTDLIL